MQVFGVLWDSLPRRGFVLAGGSEYSRPADLVVDNRSDLIQVGATPIVGQRAGAGECTRRLPPLATLANQLAMSLPLTFVERATWVGRALLWLIIPRSRSRRSILFTGAWICTGNSLKPVPSVPVLSGPSDSPALRESPRRTSRRSTIRPIVGLPVPCLMVRCSNSGYATSLLIFVGCSW